MARHHPNFFRTMAMEHVGWRQNKSTHKGMILFKASISRISLYILIMIVIIACYSYWYD